MSKSRLAIPKLTDEHRESFKVWVDEWTAIGRSCEPADRPLAEQGVRDAYAAAKLPAPPIVVWVPSPVGGAIAQAILRDGVWAGVGDGVWAGVWDGVRAGVWAGVRAGVRDGVRAGVRAGVRDWSSQVLYGQHEAGFVSFYDWFSHHGMAETVAPLEGVIAVTKSSGWWWTYQNAVILTDRPCDLHDELVPGSDRRRQMHNESGPSIVYRDGWSLWHWHGMLVPQWVVETPTVERIMSEQNAEIRRCGIESLGWDRFIPAAGLRLLDEQPDPANHPHTIALYDLPEKFQDQNDPCRVILVTNASDERDGTRRRFGLLVDRHHTDAVEAAASTFNKSKAEYLQLESAS